jgi:hypothetical protein
MLSKTKNKIVGVVDTFDGNVLRGWAYNPNSSDPVELKLIVNGKVKVTFFADKFRDDLLLHGINKGKASFNIPLNVKNFLKNFMKKAKLL